MNILILESNKITSSLIKANLEKYVFFANCDIIENFNSLKEINKEYDLYITSDVLTDSDKEHLDYLRNKKFILITNSSDIDENAIDFVRKDDISLINYLIRFVKRFINNKFLTVLLIEKDDKKREYQKELLEKINLNVETVKYLRDALRVIKNKEINFLIIDLDVDDLEIVDFVKKVRKEYKILELPIILLSKIEDMKNTMEALKLGANTFIQKSITKDAFLVKLNNILDLYNFNLSKNDVFLDKSTKIYNGFYLNILENYSKTMEQKSVVIIQPNFCVDKSEKFLIEFIEKIKNNIRKNDLIIRYEKDKLLLFMPYTLKEEIYFVLQKLKNLNFDFFAGIADEGETLAEMTRLALDRLKNRKDKYYINITH